MCQCFADALLPMLADLYPQVVRVAAIAVLERLRPEGEWRKSLTYECYVPAGEFIMGDDKRSSDIKRDNLAWPAHKVPLGAFYIGKYPVTNAEYARWMADLGRGFDMPAGKEKHPVTSVDWFSAKEYAAWAGMRLLTEAEWEKAASWETDDKVTRWQGDKVTGRKRKYPWGDTFDSAKCNTDESGIGGTTPVGKYSPAGDSPCGAGGVGGAQRPPPRANRGLTVLVDRWSGPSRRDSSWSRAALSALEAFVLLPAKMVVLDYTNRKLPFGVCDARQSSTGTGGPGRPLCLWARRIRGDYWPAARWRREPMTLADLEVLQAKASAWLETEKGWDVWLAIFSRSGFSSTLAARVATDPRLALLTPDDVMGARGSIAEAVRSGPHSL